VRALQAGAWHDAKKPLDLNEISSLVCKAIESRRLHGEVATLRQVVDELRGSSELVGDSPAMLRVRTMLRKVARSPAPRTCCSSRAEPTNRCSCPMTS
jgi:DNA-binding NtrC family response regulator